MILELHCSNFCDPNNKFLDLYVKLIGHKQDLKVTSVLA